MSPFDYIQSINTKSEYMMRDSVDEREYNPYLTVLAFSNMPETLPLANFLNQYHEIPKKAHYDFLFYTVDKNKKRSPWNKKEQDDRLKIVAEAFDCSLNKASTIIGLLTEDQLREVLMPVQTGGAVKGKSKITK